jgi:cell wall assembly regulator SMI1
VRACGAPVAQHLRPGLSDDEIERLAAPFGLSLSREARTWWGWHDGVDPELRPTTERDLGGPLQGFVTLGEALAGYGRCRRFLLDELGNRADQDWPPSWLPVTAYSGGDFVVCDCSGDSGAPSTIHIVEWEDPDPAPRAESFGDMVSAWIEAIDVGRWIYDRDTRRWYSDDTKPVAGQLYHPLV